MGGPLLLVRLWGLDSIGPLMRVQGAPEASAASGGCSEPERAGQRRRAMRARGNARCQRDTPQPGESLEVHQTKAIRTGWLFCLCAPPPSGRAHASPAARIRLAGTLRRNGFRFIQKARLSAWAFLISLRHSSFPHETLLCKLSRGPRGLVWRCTRLAQAVPKGPRPFPVCHPEQAKRAEGSLARGWRGRSLGSPSAPSG